MYLISYTHRHVDALVLGELHQVVVAEDRVRLKLQGRTGRWNGHHLMHLQLKHATILNRNTADASEEGEKHT